jgi:hypothetical protein
VVDGVVGKRTWRVLDIPLQAGVTKPSTTQNSETIPPISDTKPQDSTQTPKSEDPTNTPNSQDPAKPGKLPDNLLRQWPTLLQKANRPTPGDQIKVAPGAKESLEGGKKPLIIPNTGQKPNYSDTEKNIVNLIEKNRNNLTSRLTDKNIKVTGDPKKRSKGYSYGGLQPRIRPSSLQEKETLPSPNTTQGFTPQQIKEALFQEIRNEGSSSAIQTYDGAIFSWGSGLAHGGSLEKFVQELFKTDPEVQDILLDVGINLTPESLWMLVNTDTGLVELGDNALQLLRFNRELLSVFISIAEEEKIAENGKSHKQNVADAQWEALNQHLAFNVPKLAQETWNDINTIRFVAHCIMWGLGAKWDHFMDTGGDYAFALRREVSIMEQKSSYTQKIPETGAVVVKYEVGANYPSITVLKMADGYAINSGIVKEVEAPLENSVYFDFGFDKKKNRRVFYQLPGF